MPAAVSLLPLVCYNCQTPVPAGVDEVAWRCPNCGQGLLLDEECGTAPLQLHFAAGLPPDKPGRPFWVASGTVALGLREVYGSGSQDKAARSFWDGEHRFFIPAYASPLDQLVETGARLVTTPPQVVEGSPGPFLPIVTHPGDAQPYAEFIVMGIEAGRKDKLRRLEFTLTLGTLELWVLP